MVQFFWLWVSLVAASFRSLQSETPRAAQTLKKERGFFAGLGFHPPTIRMNSDDLTKKLSAWRVQPAVPSSFRHEVWQRIASRQAAREDSLARSALDVLARLLARPRYAAGFAALSLVVGLTVAHQQAAQANARGWQRLEGRYARTVSPFLHHAAPAEAAPHL
jgi:hypothetical protein